MTLRDVYAAMMCCQSVSRKTGGTPTFWNLKKVHYRNCLQRCHQGKGNHKTSDPGATELDGKWLLCSGNPGFQGEEL